MRNISVNKPDHIGMCETPILLNRFHKLLSRAKENDLTEEEWKILPELASHLSIMRRQELNEENRSLLRECFTLLSDRLNISKTINAHQNTTREQALATAQAWNYGRLPWIRQASKHRHSIEQYPEQISPQNRIESMDESDDDQSEEIVVLEAEDLLERYCNIVVISKERLGERFPSLFAAVKHISGAIEAKDVRAVLPLLIRSITQEGCGINEVMDFLKISGTCKQLPDELREELADELHKKTDAFATTDDLEDYFSFS